MADEELLGSRTMIRLVDDLLDFSRLESTRPILERRRLDVADLLDHQVRDVRRQPHGDRLVLDATRPLATKADPARFDQIVRNLLANALVHTETGPVLIRARAEAGTAGSPCWVRIEVTDQGPGIPEDEIARVWEPFFRGQRSLNSPRRGSGLGLAVVKQLVELHDGRVDVQSTVEGGSTFRIWLPASP
jgi:signal transduction histidine kinase